MKKLWRRKRKMSQFQTSVVCVLNRDNCSRMNPGPQMVSWDKEKPIFSQGGFRKNSPSLRKHYEQHLYLKFAFNEGVKE